MTNTSYIKNAETKLSVTELHKHYGEHEVLKGVSLSANAGDVISIIGSSGSGKSTFLRCINFLEKPSEGSISVNNQVIRLVRDSDGQLKVFDKKQLQLLRTRLTMVFQHFNLWSHMTVLENVMEAPVQVLGLSKSVAKERAILYLDKVGIDERARAKYPVHLSGGSNSVFLLHEHWPWNQMYCCLMNPLRRWILSWSVKCYVLCKSWRKRGKLWWWSRTKWNLPAMFPAMLSSYIKGSLKRKGHPLSFSVTLKAHVYSSFFLAH